MAQSIWYLKHDDLIFGPFPPAQIEEAMDAGEVSPDWEVSLNAVDWISIADSGQFRIEQAVSSDTAPDTEENQFWNEQRKQARKRWLGEGAGITDVVRDPAEDAAARSSIARDHLLTQALLNEANNQRRSPLMALLAVLLIAGIGIVVWLGQSDTPIQAGISQTADCAAALSEGVNWIGCAKRGLVQPGAKARNARLDKVQLDDARLGGSDLAYASLKSASLRNAELAQVNLSGADLSEADLTGADLTGADLRFAVLSQANLTGVRFSKTLLDKATWYDGRICAVGSVDSCQ